MKSVIEYINEVKFGANKKFDNYDAVDLGLSVKWAPCNVGSKTPEDPGLLFQWGRVDGYRYDDKNHKFLTVAKYKTNSGKKYLEKDILEPKDDAASFNIGKKWRMPTKDEFKELLSNTNIQLTSLNNVKGLKFISRTDNSKWIFFPYTGHYYAEYGGSFNGIDDVIEMWSSSCYGNDNAYRFRKSSVLSKIGEAYKYCAHCIRGVKNK